MGARVYEVYAVEHGLTVRTKDPLRTLKKVTARGFPAYLRMHAGWVLLYPETLKELEESGEAVAAFMLEPPTFRGCKAYYYVKLSLSSLQSGRPQ